MPNFFSAFTTDVFRPIATILIPGAIAISTWFIGLVWHFAAIRDLTSNRTETSLVLLLAMIFGGMVVEDAGSTYESRLDNIAKNTTHGKHEEEWDRYLRLVFKDSPIGRRYLGTLVLRLKFELGIAFAMLSAALGLLWLLYLGLNGTTFVWTELVCLGFTVWGLWEACKTHDLLARTRHNLLKGLDVVAAPVSSGAVDTGLDVSR
jgi:hypothetical protein